MPLYEYECQKCHHRFERLQQFSDRQITKCPKCKGRVEQVISAPAVQFKGSGWYVTDYAKKSSAPSSSSSSSGNDGGSSGKSEEKASDKAGEKKESKSKSEPSKKRKD